MRGGSSDIFSFRYQADFLIATTTMDGKARTYWCGRERSFQKWEGKILL
jgi:hypothetical protein